MRDPMESKSKKTRRLRQSTKKALKRASELPVEQSPQSSPERTKEQTQTSPVISQTDPTSRFRIRKPGEVREALPPVHKAASKSSRLLPPHAEDVSIRDAHEVHVIPIVRASVIQSKVRQTISLLRIEQSRAETEAGKVQAAARRDVLVALVARAPDANKCISIVEIAKRELNKEEGLEIFQYTGVWSQLEDYAPKVALDTQKDIQADAEPDGEPAFESFNFNERPKVRNVSCMVIYLARHSIAKLKDAYGEQKTARTPP